MQSPNPRPGQPAKKSRLEGATGSLPMNESCNEPVATTDIPSEPAGEPSSGMTNAHTTTQPPIDRPLINCLDAAEAFDSSDTDHLPTTAVRAQKQGGNITSMSPVVDMFPMIHSEGFSILDEFFKQPSVDLGSSSDVVGLTKGPVSAVNINCQPALLESTVIPSIPCASTAPQHPPSTAGVEFIKSLVYNCAGLIALRVDSSAPLELIFPAGFKVDLHPFLFREINKGSVILENRRKLVADLCLAANSF